MEKLARALERMEVIASSAVAWRSILRLAVVKIVHTRIRLASGFVLVSYKHAS